MPGISVDVETQLLIDKVVKGSNLDSSIDSLLEEVNKKAKRKGIPLLDIKAFAESAKIIDRDYQKLSRKLMSPIKVSMHLATEELDKQRKIFELAAQLEGVLLKKKITMTEPELIKLATKVLKREDDIRKLYREKEFREKEAHAKKLAELEKARREDVSKGKWGKLGIDTVKTGGKPTSEVLPEKDQPESTGGMIKRLLKPAFSPSPRVTGEGQKEIMRPVKIGDSWKRVPSGKSVLPAPPTPMPGGGAKGGGFGGSLAGLTAAMTAAVAVGILLADALKKMVEESKILSTVNTMISKALGLLMDLILLPFLPVIAMGLVFLFKGIIMLGMAIGKFVKDLADKIWEILGPIWDGIVKAFQEWYDTLKPIFDDLKTWLQPALTKLSEWFDLLCQKITEFIAWMFPKTVTDESDQPGSPDYKGKQLPLFSTKHTEGMTEGAKAGNEMASVNIGGYDINIPRSAAVIAGALVGGIVGYFIGGPVGATIGAAISGAFFGRIVDEAYILGDKAGGMFYKAGWDTAEGLRRDFYDPLMRSLESLKWEWNNAAAVLEGFVVSLKVAFDFAYVNTGLATFVDWMKGAFSFAWLNDPMQIINTFRDNVISAFNSLVRGSMSIIVGAYNAIARNPVAQALGMREIAGYALGGTVPGAIGAPQLAVVHGGEKITPPGQGGSGGNTTNQSSTQHNIFNFYGYQDDKFVAKVKDVMRQQGAQYKL